MDTEAQGATIDDLRRRVDEYFLTDLEPTRSGLCLAMNCTYAQLGAYQCGYLEQKDIGSKKKYIPELAALARRAVYRVNEAMERRAGVHYATEVLRGSGIAEIDTIGAPSSGPPFDLGRYKKYAR